jgi:hypothetical protein
MTEGNEIDGYERLLNGFCGGGMMRMDGGEFCIAYEAQLILKKNMRKSSFC